MVDETEKIDAEILDGLRAGDESSYERLVREYAPRLLAVAIRILDDRSEAEDALQEAFLSAFRALPSFDGRSRLSTWLHRIVVNAALTRLRRRARLPEVSVEELLPTFLDDGHRASPGSAWGGSPVATAVSREIRDEVRRSVARLPETSRNVLLLRDIQGLDTEEAAGVLGITPGATKVRLHRARQALRELLDPHLREGAVDHVS